jgi:hypothetical protein
MKSDYVKSPNTDKQIRCVRCDKKLRCSDIEYLNINWSEHEIEMLRGQMQQKEDKLFALAEQVQSIEASRKHDLQIGLNAVNVFKEHVQRNRVNYTEIVGILEKNREPADCRRPPYWAA